VDEVVLEYLAEVKLVLFNKIRTLSGQEKIEKNEWII